MYASTYDINLYINHISTAKVSNFLINTRLDGNLPIVSGINTAPMLYTCPNIIQFMLNTRKASKDLTAPLG